MAVANAAPITAMTGNVPIAVGFGNGLGAPAGFLFATIILTLFALGYVAMARHITTTGAFYGFISHGLGQVWGMASGMLATFAYVVFEGSLIGGCAYFANDAVNTIFGVEHPLAGVRDRSPSSPSRCCATSTSASPRPSSASR